MTMKATARVAAMLGFLVVAAATVGCGTIRETLPARSAMEQLLLSTAADRCLDTLPTDVFSEKAVFVEAANLDAVDKPYIIERVRAALLGSGASLPTAKDQADIVLEIASGGFSIDRTEHLFGIPAIPLPIPEGGEMFKSPELPIWKLIKFRAKAKLIFAAVDAKTQKQVRALPHCYGQAKEHHLWLLAIGPYRYNDLPKALK